MGTIIFQSLLVIAFFAIHSLVPAQSTPRVWAGGAETLFLAGDGIFHRMGQNIDGKLGLGDKHSRYLPVSSPAMAQVGAVGIGSRSIRVAKSDGTLWVAGFHYVNPGVSGLTSLHFTQAETSTDWAMVGEGDGHTVAIKNDGSLWAWGVGAAGQLGLGSTSNVSAPTRVGTWGDWTSLSVRNSVNYALRADGTMWRWGSLHGVAPTQFGSGGVWRSVAICDFHGLGIQSDGSLWAWGQNTYGQLGRGNKTDSTIPVRVGTANNWVRAAAGKYFSLGLRADGSLWAWGANFSGQLGDGSTSERTTPVQVMAGTTWAAVAAGDDHAVALRSDQAVFTWGSNAYGQLGRTGANATSPVMVDLISRPDVAVTIPPVDQFILDGASHNFPYTAVGQPLVFSATLLNLGSSPLSITDITLDGAFAHDIALPLQILPSGRQDFRITSTAANGGNFSAPLTIVTNDPDEANFDITFRSRVFADNVDTDNDGLSDAAEWHLSGFGFQWNVPNPNLLEILVNEGHRAGVHTESNFLKGDARSATGKRAPASGMATIRLRLEQGADLNSLEPTAMQDVLITPEGKLQIPVGTPGTTGFFRFALESLPAPAP